MGRRKISAGQPLKGRAEIEDYLRFFKLCQWQGDCWIWQGYCDKDGYPRFWFQDRCILAHRFAHAFFKSNPDHGLDVHHQCTRRACVYPGHLTLRDRGSHDKLYGVVVTDIPF